MKRYKCIFKYANGHTTFQVEAHNAQSALSQARLTVTEPASAVEVWDETGLVLDATERRCAGFSVAAE